MATAVPQELKSDHEPNLVSPQSEPFHNKAGNVATTRSLGRAAQSGECPLTGTVYAYVHKSKSYQHIPEDQPLNESRPQRRVGQSVELCLEFTDGRLPIQ